MPRPHALSISPKLFVIFAACLAAALSLSFAGASAAGTPTANANGSATSTANVSCTQSPAGQVAYYPAEGSPDDLQGEHNGTLRNGAVYSAGMAGGSAFIFDGADDYVEVADATDLHPQTFTLEAWVNFSSFTNDLEAIVAKSYGTCDCNNPFVLHYDPATHTLRSYSGSSEPYPQLAVPFTPVLGEWYHLAQTYDGARQEIYINGVLSGTYFRTINVFYDSNEVTIGAERVNGQTRYPFAGRIDGLSIYNRALTQAEIQSLYAAGGAGKCTPPAVSGIADQAVSANSAAGPLAFTVADAETPLENLSLAGTSSNTTLVPDANITFGGAGASRTVTVTPAANRSGRALITVAVTDSEGNTTRESFLLTVRAAGAPPPAAPLNLETVRHVNIPGCNLYVPLNGFGYDTQNRPAIGWTEASGCGGQPPLRWSRFEDGAWAERTITDCTGCGGGIRGEPADFELRQDGVPFYAYAYPDAYIFGGTWYTAHYVNLDSEPNGHGSQVRAIDSYQSCLAAHPWFAIDFAPGAASPGVLLGTGCQQTGWLSLNGPAVQGAPPFTAPAGSAGEYHNLDYAAGPDGSHHATYFSSRGPSFGAYYSNGAPGNETLLAVPHPNRGAETSVAVGADGRIHVAIGGVPLCDNDREGGLLYLTSTDGVNWARTFVDRVSGRSPSIELDSAGRPRIAYYRFNNEVRFASLDGGAWTTAPVFTATTPVNAVSVKLAYDANDRPHVLFFEQTAANEGDIQIASGSPSNLPPAALNPGNQTGGAGSPASLQINANDAEGGALSYSACGLPPGLSINPSTGLVTGTISPSAPVGSSYDVSVFVEDPAGNSASVAFKWTLVNNSPPALTNPGDQSNAEGDTVSLQLAAADPEGNALTYAAAGLPPGLTVNPASGLITGALGFNSAGTYHAVVSASDGSLSDTESFTWTVTNANRAPTASDGSAQTDEDSSVNITLAAADADGDALAFSVAADAAHGTIAISNNVATYTPAPDFNGTDSFTFKVNDGSADSNAATVLIAVSPANDAPGTRLDVYNTDEDKPLGVGAPGVLSNDTDPDGDALSARLVSGVSPAQGTLTLNPDGSFVYTPRLNFNGVASFTYRADDGSFVSDLATVSILVAPVNDAPGAVADSVTTDEDTAVTFDVLANDTDVDGDALTVLSVTNGAHGATAVVAGGVAYTPAADYCGADSFTYTVSDGNGGTATATVNVNVRPVNDQPTLASPGDLTSAEGTGVSLQISAGDVDGDAPLTYSAAGLPPGLSIDPATGLITGSLDYASAGGYHPTVTAGDGHGGAASAQFAWVVLNVNRAPAAADFTVTLDEDASQGFTLAAQDPDGDQLAFMVTGQPLYGTLTGSGTSFVYTPPPNYNGLDSITYVAGDGSLTSNIATVSFVVKPVNDPPVLATVGNQTIAEGALLAFTLGGSDPDGDALTYNSSALPPGASLNPSSGSFSWTPGYEQSGSYTVTFTVTDPTYLSASETITIVVTDVVINRGPVCSAAYPSIAEIWPPNHKQTFPVQIFGVTDPDGDPLTFRVSRVLQDEPTNTDGDGSTWIDGGGVGTAQAWVRGERAGTPRVPGNGRVYEIFFDASDGRGKSCTGSVKVTVPHDQGNKKGVAIDDGKRYDSTVAGGSCLNCH